jgi:branched-chain amino acid transport system permease protein
VSDLITYVIQGIPFGCVFALMAVGLVLTYKTSGVFNLAFGAQAFVSAAVYYDLRVRHDWPFWWALLVSVVIVGPLLGLILYRALFRYLRTAPAVAKLVASLGLLVAIPEITKLWFGSSAAYGPPSVWPPSDFAGQIDYYFQGQTWVIDSNQAATIVATVGSVILLTLLFKYTTIGLRMRAVVESPRMTELAGINSDRVSGFSWMLSSLFAGLAGVLLAPLFAQVSDQNFTILLIAAVAAAAFGRLTSIPMAFLGGILLGIAQGLLGGYLPLDSTLAQGLRPSLPFAALFLLLLFLPGLRQRREVTDPLSGVDPPPPSLAAAQRMRALTYLTWGLGIVVVGIAVFLALFVINDFWLYISTRAVIFSIIFLSVTVITGMAGQISLCQGTFAAVGFFATAQVFDRVGLSPILSMIIAAAVAAAVGGLLAIPALRLGGIYLALATLAFAFMFDSVLEKQDWVRGGRITLNVPRPSFASGDHAFFLLTLALLGILGVVVILIRIGTTGHYLDALRGSETAAASIGISRARWQVIAFAVSAAIAGLGGGLIAMQEGHAGDATYTANFTPLFGLFFLVIVITLGSRTVEGAIQAGLAFAFFPQILEALGIPKSYDLILFGLGAITFAKHPEGILEFQKRQSLQFVQRMIERARGGPPSARPPGEDVGAAREPAPVTAP